MSTDQCVDKLKNRGIKPTAARIIVFKELSKQESPVSLLELETLIDTLDKSTISRTLSVLLEHHSKTEVDLLNMKYVPVKAIARYKTDIYIFFVKSAGIHSVWTTYIFP